MTKVKVTADTNIFYYLGLNRLSKNSFISSNEKLYATPINVLEIIAGVGLNKWQERRSAARAILDYADGMTLDPDTHLISIIDCSPKKQKIPWIEACEALASAAKASELTSGVSDFKKKVIRKVKTNIANTMKNSHYDDFIAKIVDMCDSILPGYKRAFTNNTSIPTIPKNDRTKFRKSLKSPDFFTTIFIQGLAERYKLIQGVPLKFDPQNYVQLITNLAPYIFAYGGYLHELLTARRKPEKNDWGDIDLFLYLQPDTYIATAERKWWTISKHANIDHRIKKIQV